MPKPNAVVELALRAVEALIHLRTQGNDVYPPTLSLLASRIDPPPEPAALAKALSKKPVAERLLRAQKKNADSLVALAEDAARLAAEPRLLCAVLSGLCTSDKPLVPLTKVVGQVEKPLRPMFEAELKRCVAADDWPADIGCFVLKGKPNFFLHMYPLPPALEAQRTVGLLTTKLLRQLETVRPEGAWTLQQLADIVAPGASADDLRAATADKSFKARVLLALPNNLASPLALVDQAEQLAQDERVLEMALASTRTADNQAVKLADIKKKLDKKIQPAFDRAVTTTLAAGALPAAVGCLRIKKILFLFLTRDLGTKPLVGRDREEAVSVPAPSDLGSSIGAAFDRLDREKGGHNLVSLLPLRQALVVERAAFDAELQRLRRAGRFTLSAAEGRHGLSSEEREAGIVEEGVLMLYVSRTAK